MGEPGGLEVGFGEAASFDVVGGWRVTPEVNC